MSVTCARRSIVFDVTCYECGSGRFRLSRAWFLFSLALILGGVAATPAPAQIRSYQNYTLRVPSNLSITAPVDVVMMHDQTDAIQNFPAQRWRVMGNSMRGVAVAFSTVSPFVHTNNPDYQRDVQLGLAVVNSSGPSQWVLTQASDATNYSRGDPIAAVSARSNGSAAATFELFVSFVTGTYGSVPSGEYRTTVVGTITAN